ncbi:hypothetical protein MNZ22_11905 [Aeromonas encheleia]|uniref:hypothetical protein n=1 Tax=Aeromonas encheleia TaxID=73010 RepID=UPI001F5A244B|nr:hypothetical protein [Aeromonas encheleia]UNP87537.1 hypothetical protein MNZ22_11905 [Aeromonas encheleia]
MYIQLFIDFFASERLNGVMDISHSCSHYFTFEMLFHCGETWQRTQCTNLPLQLESWQAYAELAQQILDPLTQQHGPPLLTYGFCGAHLRRAIQANPSPQIAPELDQHAACERNRVGRLICPRQGAAVDLFYPGQNNHAIGLWLAQYTPFDRLYLYGSDQPLHISYGPEQCRTLVQLVTHQGRRIPKRLTLDKLRGWF